MSVKTKLPKGYLDMGRDEYADLDLDTQRAVYVELRDIVAYTMGKDAADIAIAKQVDACAPEGWLIAVRAVTCKCERCRGTGTYSWGACINGRMTHSAPCARCGGDGKMTFDDMRRGRAYDNHSICAACR